MAALLLGLIHPSAWFFYRKMYVEGSIIFLFIILLGWFSELFKPNGSIMTAIGIGLNIGLARAANEIYLSSIRRKINKGYHMCPSLKNTDAISLTLTIMATIFWVACILKEEFILFFLIDSLCLLIWVSFSMINDKNKVQYALNNQ